MPDYRPVRSEGAPGEDGAPAAWDPSRPREHRAGEASDGQIAAQLDRYLIRWLGEHAKPVIDGVPQPNDLEDLGGAELTTHLRRCAQALLRADGVAAASHPDAVDRVL